MLLELFRDPGTHPVVAGLGVRAGLEARCHALGDIAGTKVGGHDDHSVLEVHHSALGVGQSAVFQNLQQRVEEVRVGLLHFIEQDHGERTPADLLGQLASFFVADIARRCTEETRNRVLLGVLGHVQRDEGVLFTEQELCKGLGELGLAHAGGGRRR